MTDSIHNTDRTLSRPGRDYICQMAYMHGISARSLNLSGLKGSPDDKLVPAPSHDRHTSAPPHASGLASRQMYPSTAALVCRSASSPAPVAGWTGWRQLRV